MNGYPGLNIGITDLHKLIQPDLTVADGTIAMVGRGPFDGDPVRMGLVLAGESPVWVDAAGATLIGFDPEEIPSIRVCIEIDSVHFRHFQIVALAIELIKRKFKPCPMEVCAGENIKVFTGEVCSGCLATLNTAIDRLMKRHDLEKVKTMVVGVGKKPKIPQNSDKRLYVGKCAAPGELLQEGKEIHIVEGCPPTGRRIFAAVKDMGK